MTQEEKKSKQSLKEVIERFDILIEYSALQSNLLDLFLTHWKEEINYGSKSQILITFSDWFKLKSYAQKGNEKIKHRLHILEKMEKDHQLRKIIGGQYFQGVFEALKKESEICILVQNVEKLEALYQKEDFSNIVALTIRKINNYGYLSKFRNDMQKKYEYQIERQIDIPKSIQRIQNKKITFRRLPISGDKVIGKIYGEFILKEKIADFDDGIHFRIDDKLMAKIYRKKHINTLHLQKLIAMINMRISTNTICWPVDILFDVYGDFIGYLFNAYNGSSMQLSIMKQAGLESYFPNWDRQDLIQLAITVIKQVQYLHWKNILLGCVDLNSIYVEDVYTVYFTNVDCYQFEQYPCMLRNSIFIPPERLDYMNEIFMFTDKTERYVLAVLLFMIMLPGKEPYTQRWGNYIKNIKEGKFPYAYGENHSKGVPIGLWRFVWSHLYKPLKEAFYLTFQKGSDKYNPNDRYSDDFWLDLFKRYNDLKNSDYYKIDENSKKIFPNTFRRSKKDNLQRCEACQLEFPDWYMNRQHPTVCSGCIGKMSDERFTCVLCGRTFIYSIREKKNHEAMMDWKPTKRCKECKQKQFNRVQK